MLEKSQEQLKKEYIKKVQEQVIKRILKASRLKAKKRKELNEKRN